jgi:serine/threonine-protein kinase
MRRRFRRRQRLGQYRIEKCLAVGGFAEVYQAHDTVEGINVALKIPHRHLTDKENMAAFKKEVRMVAGLDHPGILGIKTAGKVDGTFVVVSSLAQETLGDRMTRRMARSKVLEIVGELLEALAYAHKRKVVHCDVKPENILLFPGQRVRLADFGLARLALRTIDASGSGTLGYMAPEQALGRPSLRSDVFSAGVVLWRLLGGTQPEWPFHWPHPSYEKVQRNWSEAMVEIARKATKVDEEKRYKDAGAMLRAFKRAAPDAIATRRRL